MAKHKIVITDHGFADIETEMHMARSVDAELVAAQCKPPAEVIAKTSDADALLVQWAPASEVLAMTSAGVLHCAATNSASTERAMCISVSMSANPWSVMTILYLAICSAVWSPSFSLSAVRSKARSLRSAVLRDSSPTRDSTSLRRLLQTPHESASGVCSPAFRRNPGRLKSALQTTESAPP